MKYKPKTNDMSGVASEWRDCENHAVFVPAAAAD
jgi:hypothetical protein